jgi:hypothetical protein
MTRTVTVICDGCGNEVPVTSFAREDYLALVPMPRSHAQGFVFPEERRLLTGEKHFCNFRCLDEWSERRP